MFVDRFQTALKIREKWSADPVFIQLIHFANILENPSSFTIMFYGRSYEMPIVAAIYLIFNLRSPIIRSRIFSMFSWFVAIEGRPLRGSSLIFFRPCLNSAADFLPSYIMEQIILKLPLCHCGFVSPLTLFYIVILQYKYLFTARC